MPCGPTLVSGMVQGDPKEADRGPYQLFCGTKATTLLIVWSLNGWRSDHSIEET